jgi:hypothetical protein
MTWFPRALGLVTAAYGAAIIARPALLLRPSGLLDDGEPSLSQATVVRALGARDLVSGLAMVTARTPSALRTALAVRVASDLGDTVVLGAALRGRPERAKAVGVAVGWGALCALSALTVRRT